MRGMTSFLLGLELVLFIASVLGSNGFPEEFKENVKEVAVGLPQGFEGEVHVYELPNGIKVVTGKGIDVGNDEIRLNIAMGWGYRDEHKSGLIRGRLMSEFWEIKNNREKSGNQEEDVDAQNPSQGKRASDAYIMFVDRAHTYYQMVAPASSFGGVLSKFMKNHFGIDISGAGSGSRVSQEDSEVQERRSRIQRKIETGKNLNDDEFRVFRKEIFPMFDIVVTICGNFDEKMMVELYSYLNEIRESGPVEKSEEQISFQIDREVYLLTSLPAPEDELATWILLDSKDGSILRNKGEAIKSVACFVDYLFNKTEEGNKIATLYTTEYFGNNAVLLGFSTTKTPLTNRDKWVSDLNGYLKRKLNDSSKKDYIKATDYRNKHPMPMSNIKTHEEFVMRILHGYFSLCHPIRFIFSDYTMEPVPYDEFLDVLHTLRLTSHINRGNPLPIMQDGKRKQIGYHDISRLFSIAQEPSSSGEEEYDSEGATHDLRIEPSSSPL